MTGWYPHVRGHRTMHHMLRPDEPMLLKILKDGGYHVWWGGKNDVIPGQGSFDPYCSVKFHPGKNGTRALKSLWMMDREKEWRGDPGDDRYYSFHAGKLDAKGEDIYHDSDWANVLEAVRVIKDAPKDKSLCVYLPLVYPHPPYGVEDPWFSRIPREKVSARIQTPKDWSGKPSILRGIYERQNLKSWTEDRWNELRAVYLGMCARIDHQFGLILDALLTSGIYDDTAVFFFSDHGDFTGDYGLVEKTQNTFEDCLTRVPFVFKPPASRGIRPGHRDGLVELIDFTATVYDVTGLTPGYTHFGKSLLAFSEGEANHRDAVFAEGGRLREETHCMEKDSPGSGNPASLYWPRSALQQSGGPEHGKAVMCRTKDFKYVRRFYETDELYDLKTDPGETKNLFGDPKYRDTLAALKSRMLDFFIETGDVVPHFADSR